ncbi:MAG: OB-fold domain-containing protein [Bordetella sp.]|nr:OB-fold domain-containing protein [Bordetella sp.]
MSTPARKPPIVVTATSAPFWEGVRAKKLLLQYDAGTGRYQFFPRASSLSSEGATEWRESKGEGTLVAFTRTSFPAAGFAHLLPYLEGLVRLDEGPRIFAPITGVTMERLAVGQRMRVVFTDGDDAHPFEFQPL